MKILLCTDLDRTLLPNGSAPETTNIRLLFNELIDNFNIKLAYVSGRNADLVQQAISQYGLPQPDWVVSDVGTSIYKTDQAEWQYSQEWENQISHDWHPCGFRDIESQLQSIDALVPQPPIHQNTFKLSYYLDLKHDHKPIFKNIHARLNELGIHYNLIWSIDEPNKMGLVDILPANATKLHAIEYIAKLQNLQPEQIVFSGDSGNDLPVMKSVLRSIIVKNAHSEVMTYIERLLARSRESADNIYIARGQSGVGNGNYASGIIEGLIHYHPNLEKSILKISDQLLITSDQ